MLMNSHFDGYVFGQAVSPVVRRQLKGAAARGNRAAMRVVAAQNQLGSFGDDEDEQGSGLKTGDGSSIIVHDDNLDANGWPPSSSDQPATPPPPPPPPAGTGMTLNDVKGYGNSVVTGVGEAADAYNKVRSAVAPTAAQVGSQQAVVASTYAGNQGAMDPGRIAAAVTGFRTKVAAFISNPCAANVNSALDAFHTALDAYSNDKGNPSQSTASIISKINMALTTSIRLYDDTYNAYKEGAVQPAGPSYTAAAPAAARMANKTMVAGAPPAAYVAQINAAAGLNPDGSNGGAPAPAASGMSGGTLAAIAAAAWFFLK